MHIHATAVVRSSHGSMCTMCMCAPCVVQVVNYAFTLFLIVLGALTSNPVTGIYACMLAIVCVGYFATCALWVLSPHTQCPARSLDHCTVMNTLVALACASHGGVCLTVVCASRSLRVCLTICDLMPRRWVMPDVFFSTLQLHVPLHPSATRNQERPLRVHAYASESFLVTVCTILCL